MTISLLILTPVRYLRGTHNSDDQSWKWVEAEGIASRFDLSTRPPSTDIGHDLSHPFALEQHPTQPSKPEPNIISALDPWSFP